MPNNATTVTVHNLQPDATYTFAVMSRDQLGEAHFSDNVTAVTKGLCLRSSSQLCRPVPGPGPAGRSVPTGPGRAGVEPDRGPVGTARAGA